MLIEAWTLELLPARALNAAPVRTPHKRALLPVPETSKPNTGRWIAAGAGFAVIAGSVSLNLAANHDSAIDQPTDFVPALLYLAGATLIGAAIFAD